MAETIKNKATATIDGVKIIDSNEVVLEYVAGYKDPKIDKKSSVNTIASYGKATFTFDIKNQDAKAATIVFSDILDPRIVYVAASFKVDGVAKTPTTTAPVTYTLVNVAGLATVVVTFDVEAV